MKTVTSIVCILPQMFRAEEIEMLVCGCPYLDILALEEVTVYEGYCKSDSTIK